MTDNNKIFELLNSRDLESFHLGVITFMQISKQFESLKTEEIKNLYYNLPLFAIADYAVTPFKEYGKYVNDIREAFSRLQS